MKRLKKLTTVLLALVMVFAMAACGENQGKVPDAKGDNDTPKVDKKDPTETEKSGIRRGGTLIVAKTNAFANGLDITQDSYSGNIMTGMSAIYEGLIKIDEKGNPSPGLATEWEYAEDGLSLTLKLREDVSFSNGEKFNAEAVAKCMNFYLSEECKHIFRSSDLALLTNVDVVDEYTVRVNLSAQDSGLLMALASTSGYIAAPSVVDNRAFGTNPIGTGPFVLKEYKEGEYLSVVANPNYYIKGEDGKALPYLDGIKFVIMPDDTTEITNLKSGDVHGIDIVGSSTSVLTAQNMSDAYILSNPVAQNYNICSNLHSSVMQNEKLRQAICYAINPQEIIDIAMDGLGEHVPFWTNEGKWFYNDYTPYSFDLEKAKSLMDDAGLSDGLELELAIIARDPDKTVAQLVQAQLDKIGITVKINATDAASWIAYVRNDHKGDLSLSLCGNVYEPSKGWVVILNSFGGVGTGVEFVDQLSAIVKSTKTELDSNKRNQLMAEYQKKILDSGLSAGIGLKHQYAAFLSKVQNVKFNYYGWLEFDNAWMKE